MNADFTIKFIINRITPSLQILLTDTSSAVTNLAANFKITFPDGTTYQNVDFVTSPDINSPGDTVTITAPTASSDGEIQRGAYVFEYTALNQDTDEIQGEVKQFSFTFDEPEIEISNSSDVAIPKVAFKVDVSDFTQTDWTETITTFRMTSPFPITSDQNGSSVVKDMTLVDNELDQVNASSYYEGVYNPVLDYIADYQNSSLAYLSLTYSEQVTASFTINAIQTATALLEAISDFRSGDGACNDETYCKIMALYSNLESAARENVVDEGNVLYSELIGLLNIVDDSTYQSGPISGLVFASQDLTNYYNRTEIDNFFNSLDISLTREIIVSVFGQGLGGYDFEESIAQGTSLTDVFEGLLRSSNPAVYTQPTLVMTGSNLVTGNLVGEVGVSEVVTLSPVWTQNDAGVSTSFDMTNNGIPFINDSVDPIPDASYNDTIVLEGNYPYVGSVSHDQGPVNNDQFGNPDPSGQIAAGVVNSNTVTYKKVYPYYFGTGTPAVGADILAGTKVIEEIGSFITADYQNVSPEILWFAVPSDHNNNKTYTAWEDASDSNNAGSIGGTSNLFGDPITISVTTSGLDSNYTINYDVYISNFATLALEAQLS